MSKEPKLERVFSGSNPLVDVIFIHGFIGDSRTTWSDESGDEFWPNWLKSDIDKISVYTVGYRTSLFERQDMDVFELAGTLLDLFVSNGIGEKPVAFIAHSFGGILAKLILRKSCESADNNCQRVSDATKLVVFLSTPHTGTSISNILRIIPKKSKQLNFLANEIGYLEDLNEHYRNFADGRDDHLTVVYYETKAMNRTLVVVPRRDADPGVSRARPVALQKDHVEICKPYSKEDIAYLGIKRHIENLVKLAEQPDPGAPQLLRAINYQEKSSEDRRDLLQKLIDAGREHEYHYANPAQNRLIRRRERR